MRVVSAARNVFVWLLDSDVGTLLTEMGRPPSTWPKEELRAYSRHLFRRFLLPVVPAVVLSLVVVVGQQQSLRLYTLTATPLWYWVNILQVLYALVVLYKPTCLSLTQVAATSLAMAIFLALAENITAIVTSSAHASWAVGNTIFGLCLLVLPALVYRNVRSWSGRDGPGGSRDAVLPWPGSEKLPRRNSEVPKGHRRRPSTPPLPSRPDSASPRQTDSFDAPSWAIVIIVAVSVLFGLLLIWSNYMPSDTPPLSWQWMLLLAVPQVLLVICGRRQRYAYSFAYAALYVVVFLRMPDFLGHVTAQLFARLELQTSLKAPAWLPFVKLALRVGYMAVMHVFMTVLGKVCERMAEVGRYPRFLFIGQVYYYMLWYLFIATDSSSDWLFWCMLLLMNANYVLGPTGHYLEALRASLVCGMRVGDCGGSSTRSNRHPGFIQRCVGCAKGAGRDSDPRSPDHNSCAACIDPSRGSVRSFFWPGSGGRDACSRDGMSTPISTCRQGTDGAGCSTPGNFRHAAPCGEMDDGNDKHPSSRGEEHEDDQEEAEAGKGHGDRFGRSRFLFCGCCGVFRVPCVGRPCQSACWCRRNRRTRTSSSDKPPNANLSGFTPDSSSRSGWRHRFVGGVYKYLRLRRRGSYPSLPSLAPEVVVSTSSVVSDAGVESASRGQWGAPEAPTSTRHPAVSRRPGPMSTRVGSGASPAFHATVEDYSGVEASESPDGASAHNQSPPPSPSELGRTKRQVYSAHDSLPEGGALPPGSDMSPPVTPNRAPLALETSNGGRSSTGSGLEAPSPFTPFGSFRHGSSPDQLDGDFADKTPGSHCLVPRNRTGDGPLGLELLTPDSSKSDASEVFGGPFDHRARRAPGFRLTGTVSPRGDAFVSPPIQDRCQDSPDELYCASRSPVALSIRTEGGHSPPFDDDPVASFNVSPAPSPGASPRVHPRTLSLHASAPVSPKDVTALNLLLFRIRVAEQDTLADFCSLVSVPTWITLLAFLGDTSPRVGAPRGYAATDLWYLWLRFAIMAGARSISARLARTIFTTKLTARPSAEDTRASHASEGGTPDLSSTAMGIFAGRPFYSATMANLKECFWLYVSVLILCGFACFQTDALPTRFAFFKFPGGTEGLLS